VEGSNIRGANAPLVVEWTSRTRFIVVNGATGRQGSAAVKTFRARGWAVRGLSRDPARPAAKAIIDLGAEVVKADLSDADAVRTGSEEIPTNRSRS
jgi:nucleoside-diphosphate-sugar epimerase